MILIIVDDKINKLHDNIYIDDQVDLQEINNLEEKFKKIYTQKDKLIHVQFEVQGYAIIS